MNRTKKAPVAEKAAAVKEESKSEKTPYMSRGIYNNYAKVMKEKNQQRQKQGLESLPIRSYEEWSRK